MPLVVKKDETFDPMNVSLPVLSLYCRVRIAWRTWSSNFGFGAVGGVEASVLKFNPPSITASVWFVGLCVLTLFIIMTLLVISRIAAPLSRGGRHQPSVTSLSVHSNCRNDGTKILARQAMNRLPPASHSIQMRVQRFKRSRFKVGQDRLSPPTLNLP